MDEGLKFQRENRIRLSKNGYKQICNLVDERDEFKCVICNSHWAIHHHHVIFRSAMGSDTINNLVCVCARCHDVYCHGIKEKRWRNCLLEYLGSWKCKMFELKNKEKLEKIYERNRK